ncbi:MAG: DUF3883 domain-containing protein [Candidatus Pacebacteria bacterium]|nr:DUF3883 domain-containing protein [Candidatus Paceibacterota bacterium]MCK6623432.1 DUF3883 domain-containing protein [Calditrichia bacterium]NUQ44162.1 DUF3883 domain-containing protein [Calditrichaceae bacterium]
MSADNYFSISPGIIIALWRILSLTARYEQLSVKSVVEITQNSGLFGGKVPAKNALKFGQIYNFIEIQSGSIYLTEHCKEEFIDLCNDDEPNTPVFRAILSHIISNNNYHWLMFFNEDSDIFRTAIPQDWIDLLENAGLFSFDNDDVIEWWETVLKKYENFTESKKKEIGDIGEKLTYEYELNRLITDKIKKPKFYVKWASRFSDEFGYDILSLRGNLLKGKYKIKDQIQIEVKATVVRDTATFRFRVSRNEWNVASNRLSTYFFFCWTGVSLEHQNASDGPYIISAKSLEKHLPTDKSEICEWTECRFVLDLTKYGIKPILPSNYTDY